MASPDAWSFTGTSVTGSGVTYNYTVEFETIANRINEQNTILNNVLAAITAQTTAFNTAFSPTASSTAGTVNSIMGAMLRVQDTQSAAQQNSSDNLAAIGAALTGQSDNAVSQIGSSLAVLNATAQIFVAQQNKKAEFEKAATQSALKRSGLPEVEVPQPTLEDAIKSSVSDAGIVAVQANATGFITTQVGKGAEFASDLALDYVQDTALYASAKQKWDALKASISGNTAAGETTEASTKQAEADVRISVAGT